MGRSDVILTTVGEELGLTGVIAVLLLYGLLGQRGLRTAVFAKDPFGKLLAVGLTTRSCSRCSRSRAGCSA